MEALRTRKKQMEMGETSTGTVPKLIGHIEKIEEEEIVEDPEDTDVVPTEGTGDGQLTDKGTVAAAEKDSGEQTASGGTDDTSTKSKQGKSTKEDKKDEPKKKPRSTPSAARLKEERCQAKISEQERRWREAMERGLAEAPAGEVDLKDAMMSPEEEEKQAERIKENGRRCKLWQSLHQDTREEGGEKLVESREERAGRKKEERGSSCESSSGRSGQDGIRRS